MPPLSSPTILLAQFPVSLDLNRRFVLASNTAHGAQKCPTVAVAPTGRVLAEVGGPDFATRRVPLDLGLVSNWYLDQARRDVVAVWDARASDLAGHG